MKLFGSDTNFIRLYARFMRRKHLPVVFRLPFEQGF